MDDLWNKVIVAYSSNNAMNMFTIHPLREIEIYAMLSVTINVHVPPRLYDLLQWLKLSAWKVGNRGFEPHSALQIVKKQKVSCPLTNKNSILWGTSVTER